MLNIKIELVNKYNYYDLVYNTNNQLIISNFQNYFS